MTFLDSNCDLKISIFLLKNNHRNKQFQLYENNQKNFFVY